ncbi:MAG TPA: amino acid adenylation domain-containing protein, partial [Longimicrobium sp.]
MVNDTRVVPGAPSLEEKRKLLVQKLQERAQRGVFPLSFSQQRLWFLHRMDPGSPAYHIPLALRVRGELDARVLRRAVRALVQRHEALRTTFSERDGRPVQVVAPEAADVLAKVDLRGLREDAREAELRRLAQDAATRPFDLAEGPLFRALAVRMEDDDWGLLFTLHHIVADGWSMGVMVRELSELYAAHAQGRPPALPPLGTQYPEYALWQRGWLKGEVLARETAFWRGQLEGAPRLLELPTDRPRPAVASQDGDTRTFSVGAGVLNPLRALARQEGATLFMTLLAAWQLLLGRYAGQDDVLVGTPIAGRTREELEGVVGFFVNTLVIRARVGEAGTFRQLLRQVRETTLGAYGHQHLPFEKLVEELSVERSLAHTPLFQVMFSLQNNEREELSLGGSRVEAVKTGTAAAKFDLNLTASEGADVVVGTLAFRTDLFDGTTAERLMAHFTALLAAVAADPDRALAAQSLLDADERRRVLGQWSAAPAALPDGTVHGRFARQAARTPDAPAVVFASDSLTYAELDARANRLAHRLRALGVGPEARVGLCLERGVDVVTAILGILKAGGAYVPLDPAHPDERLAWILADADARALVSSDAIASRFGGYEGAVVRMDADELASESAAAPVVAVDGDHLAYVIYTSGSTGRPKGVMVRHGAVVNLHGALERAVYATRGAAAPPRVSVNGPVSFDTSVKQVVQLLGGATLCMVPEAARYDADALAAYLRAQAVEVLDCTPAQLRHLMAEGLLEKAGPALTDLLVAGEAIDPQLWQALAALDGIRAWNLYGPTETTVDASLRAVTGTRPLLGGPVANARLYVLDAAGAPLPAGIPGELHVGGAGVARGYAGRPALTAERFVPDAFSGLPGARLYRTGDRVRWTAEGELEYLGRTDFQVKVSGFRIEPGEVESALEAHPAVGRAVVVARADGGGEKRLVGYVVAAPGADPQPAELRAALKGTLPEHMVPSAIVRLDALPLTPNGKVDRRALPAPELDAGAEAYVEPRTAVEEIVAGIFAEVLRVEHVGARDDFFVLGGHSLIAVRVVSRVRDAFGVELPLRALFEASTVEALAARVESLGQAGADAAAPPLVPFPRDGTLPLSFAQQRLWFIDQLNPGSAAYNMPYALRLRGPLDVAALEHALTQIVRRHEGLRTRFPSVDGEPLQVIDPPYDFRIHVEDLTALDGDAQHAEVRRRAAAEAGRPFDLAAGPLIRITVLGLGTDDHAVFFTLHHIVSDGWSTDILIAEVSELYAAYVDGRAPVLRPLPIQYADYAAWQHAWMAGEVLEGQLGYWRERLAGAPPMLELPTDRPRAAAPTERGGRVPLMLSRETVDGLKALSRREGATLFMTLLAAWQLLLSRWSGQDDVVVGSPVANRGRAEVEGLIGFFVNSLALRTDLRGDPTVRGVLRRVREGVLQAQAHQDLPFERLVEGLGVERVLGRMPVFQVFFAFQNAAVDFLRMGDGLQAEPLSTHDPIAKFDLMLALGEAADVLRGSIVYRAELFDEGTIERMADHLRRLLDAMAADPEARISRLPLLSGDERTRLLGWSGTARGDGYPSPHALFAAQAARTPDAPAVLADGETLSYAELDARANRLAHLLRARGVGPESRVGVAMARSPRLVTALLAIVKAGGAYVPLDTGYPAERLAFMLADSAVSVLLVDDALPGPLAGFGGAVVSLQADAAEIDRQPADALGIHVHPDTLAYVVYTSGSTGRPKGIGIPLKAVVRLVRGADFAQLGEDDRVAQVSNTSFDAFTWELWGTLLNGGALVCLDRDTLLAPAALVDAFRRHGVTAVFLTTALFNQVARDVPEGFAPLRHVLFGGEAVDPSSVRRVLEHGAPGRLLHVYGPTESTTFSTWHPVRHVDEGAVTVPIGTSVANTTVYVLEGAGEPAPIGVSGELFLGGDGLARGYLGRAALTAERFVPHPFVPGARLYRTGDAVRWNARGEIEFVGRLDQQVKVRGFRIELGEIEAALCAHPGVREAAVVTRREGDDHRLVGYVVPAEGQAVAFGELRKHLRLSLPDYMVPASWVALDAMPLTPNGKTDHRALPAPDAAADGEGYVAPRTPTEEILAGMYAEVLRAARVGAEDDFFALGGHSLLATRLVSRVREAFGVELPLRALFEAPRVSALAERVDALAGAGEALPAPPLLPVERAGDLPLSFAQQRLWFIDQLEPGGSAYNVPYALRLTGPLDVDALERSLSELVRRHETLRTRFPSQGGEPVQVIDPAGPVRIPVADLRALPPNEREERAQEMAVAEAARPFDLRTGPLVRAALLRLDDEEHALLFTLHHVISDGWSMGVLIREVSALYGAFAEGTEAPLPALPVQYADFAAWQRQWISGAVLEAQMAYWRERLAGAPALLELPTDRPRPAVQTYRGALEGFRLPAEPVR